MLNNRDNKASMWAIDDNFCGETSTLVNFMEKIAIICPIPVNTAMKTILFSMLFEMIVKIK